MDFENILQQVIALAQAQFGKEVTGLAESTTAADVPGWNSLTHVMLVGSIERSFDIKFDLMEMVEMKSIGDIARATYEAIR
jgi:acyl carrier protein